MIPYVRFCTTSCLVFVSALATAQVLTKSNSGLTTPEYVQVLAHSSGSIPLPYLTSLSAQDVNGDGKPDLLTTGLDPLSNPVAITSTLLRNAGSENFTQVFGNNSSYCQPVPAYAVAANTVAPFCTLADLNGDGLPDKIFAGEYPNASNPGEVDYPYIKVEYATGRGRRELHPLAARLSNQYQQLCWKSLGRERVLPRHAHCRARPERRRHIRPPRH